MSKLILAFLLLTSFVYADLGTYKHGKLINPDTNDSYTGNLRQHYINQVASRVKEQWRYQGAQDHWGCDVYILQDLNGKVQSVNLQSCNVSNSAKAKVFKDSIERAVYKASPLPAAPNKSVFDREILFHFGVAASIMEQDIDVELTTANAKMAGFTEQQPTIITINKEGEYFINSLSEDDFDVLKGEKVALGIIAGRVSARLAIYPNMKVFVRGDASVAYGSVVSLMSFLQKNGVDKVSIMTKPQD